MRDTKDAAASPSFPAEAPLYARTHLIRRFRADPLGRDGAGGDKEGGLPEILQKQRADFGSGNFGNGIDDTDATAQRVTGWVVIMPDRRTIQLRDQPIGDPVVFSSQDGTRNELQITNVTGSSATGYLLVSKN